MVRGPIECAAVRFVRISITSKSRDSPCLIWRKCKFDIYKINRSILNACSQSMIWYDQSKKKKCRFLSPANAHFLLSGPSWDYPLGINWGACRPFPSYLFLLLVTNQKNPKTNQIKMKFLIAFAAVVAVAVAGTTSDPANVATVLKSIHEAHNDGSYVNT